MHPGIVPPGHMSFVHEAQQLSFAHHGIVEHQAGKLGLLRGPVKADLANQPIVDVPVVLEFEGAERVGDPLDGVGEAVRVVVERVGAPGVAAPVVMGMTNPDQERISHDHVGVGQVDLGPYHVGAVGKLARFHSGQQIEILGHGSVPVPARGARNGNRAPMGSDVSFRFTVDVRFTLGDQGDREVVQFLEIVAGVELVVPLKAEPLDVSLDGFDVPDVLGRRVGVVKAEVDLAAELLGNPEVETDRLGVTDMGKPVGFRGKAGADLAAEPAAGHVVGDLVANKIPFR